MRSFCPCVRHFPFLPLLPTLPCLILLGALVLHPKMKMQYFTQYWDKDLHGEVRESVETIVSTYILWYGVLLTGL